MSAHFNASALIGQQFQKLTVRAVAPKKHKRQRVLVECECGNEKVVDAKHMVKGRIGSCGCRLTRHGMTGTPEWYAYQSMLSRCTRPKNAGYHNYGGRGITICERWLGADGFINFLADMGSRPSPTHSIDRKNNEGGYCPENCRWATKAEQSRNKRDVKMFTYQGLTMCVKDHATRLGLRPNTIRMRMRRGATFEEAISLPVTPVSEVSPQH